MFSGPNGTFERDVERLIEATHAALYSSKICANEQGMALLRAASGEYGYDLDLAQIARIWCAGCIIRANFLDEIGRVYDEDLDLPNLLLSPELNQALADRQEAWRYVVTTAATLGIPMPGTMASLGYYDSYRSGRLPANLIQAQRDNFGAHTFERVDRARSFYREWGEA